MSTATNLDPWEQLCDDDPRATDPAWFDVHGIAIRLPAEVRGFRARHWPPGAHGRGTLLYDDETGVPVFVPRACSPEEFRDLVGWRPGRYQLLALDEEWQPAHGIPAAEVRITEAVAARAARGSAPGQVTTTPAAPPSLEQSMVPLLLDLVRSLATDQRQSATPQVLGELVSLLKAQTTEHGKQVSDLVRASATVVTAADGAGISRRDPLPTPPVMVAPHVDERVTESPDPGASAPDVLSLITNTVQGIAPMATHWLNTRILGMSSEQSAEALRAVAAAKAAAANANNATGAPTPATAPTAAQGAQGAPAAPTTTDARQGIDPALYGHLIAISQYLRPDEVAVIRSVLERATPEHRQWLQGQVAARSVPEAVVWVRELLAQGKTAATEGTEP